MKTRLIIASIVAALLAVSTGVGFWMWSDAKAELTDTVAQLASAKLQLASIEAQLTNSKVDLAEAQAELVDTNAQLMNTRTELTNVRAELASTKIELTNTKAKLVSTQAELAAIEELFPPRYFEDVTELDLWINSQPKPNSESSDAVQWLDRALGQQKVALNDGYIINVELWDTGSGYYYVDCTAMLQDGSYYFWDPDTNEIGYMLDYRHF